MGHYIIDLLQHHFSFVVSDISPCEVKFNRNIHDVQLCHTKSDDVDKFLVFMTLFVLNLLVLCKSLVTRKTFHCAIPWERTIISSTKYFFINSLIRYCSKFLIHERRGPHILHMTDRQLLFTPNTVIILKWTYLENWT